MSFDYSAFGVYTVPPVEARPDQPLPKDGPFLRVFAEVQEPETALLRCARQVISVYKIVYAQGRNAPETVHEQLSLLIWLINQEAGGHVSAIATADGTPVNPSSYGEMVAWLSWKYLLYVLRGDQPEHVESDAAELYAHCMAFNELVEDVMAARVRLPENMTEVMPPRTWRMDQAATSASDAKPPAQ